MGIDFRRFASVADEHGEPGGDIDEGESQGEGTPMTPGPDQPPSCSYCGGTYFEPTENNGRLLRSECEECGGTQVSHDGIYWQPDLIGSPHNHPRPDADPASGGVAGVGSIPQRTTTEQLRTARTSLIRRFAAEIGAIPVKHAGFHGFVEGQAGHHQKMEAMDAEFFHDDPDYVAPHPDAAPIGHHAALSNFIMNHHDNHELWSSKARLTNVDLTRPVMATQPYVVQSHIDRYQANPHDQTAMAHEHGADAHLGNQHPLFVRHEGQMYAADGHHRIGAALMSSRPHLRGYVYDADEHGFADGKEHFQVTHSGLHHQARKHAAECDFPHQDPEHAAAHALYNHDDGICVATQARRARKHDHQHEHEHHRKANMNPELGFHVTATWADVRAKAMRIRAEGGVTIKIASPDGVGGEVRGDHGTYETVLNYLPGSRKVGGWHCGCAWGTYAWDRAPAYRRFQGRLCSHGLAMQLEAQSHDRPVFESHPGWMRHRRTRHVVESSVIEDVYPEGHDLDLVRPPVYAFMIDAIVHGQDPAQALTVALDAGMAHTAAKVLLREAMVDPLSVTAEKASEPDGAPTHAGLVLKAADTGRVLMLQRSHEDEDDPARGRWEFPGGGIEEHDHNSLHGAFREFAEEVGHPVPPGGTLQHVWRSGPYVGHVMVVPSEAHVPLHEARSVDNPDGDHHEQSAWWEPGHAQKNPALREECRTSPWKQIAEASRGTTAALHVTAFGEGTHLSWNEIGERHPHIYGDPDEHDHPDAERGDGFGIGDAVNYLAHSTPDNRDADGHSVHDLWFHEAHVDPKHIDYAPSMGTRSQGRALQAHEGFAAGKGDQIPPVVLVHRHGVYQVADGHHRAEGAHMAGTSLRAYVAHSPFPDEPDHEGERAPFHGKAEPVDASDPHHKTAIYSVNDPLDSPVEDPPTLGQTPQQVGSENPASTGFATSADPVAFNDATQRSMSVPDMASYAVYTSGEQIAPEVSMVVVASSAGFWRVHPNDRPFAPWAAHSTIWGQDEDDEDRDGDETQSGFSTFRHPHELYRYFMGEESIAHDGKHELPHDESHVVHFPGTEIGKGHDGEPQVMPHEEDPQTGRSPVHQVMTWHDFKHNIIGSDKAREMRKSKWMTEEPRDPFKGRRGSLHDEPEGALPSTDGADDSLWDDQGAQVRSEMTDSIDDTESVNPTNLHGASLSPRIPSQVSTNDILIAFQATAGAKALGNAQGAYVDDTDIAAAARAHLSKAAVKAFTPTEQQELITEGVREKVRARNADRLQISGTHYESLAAALEAHGDPDDCLII